MIIEQKNNKFEKAFTIIELLVVAPIIIIFISTFVATIISMTGKVMINRSEGVLEYSVQSAFDIIEQDIKNSGAYLATNNFTPTSPQGLSDDATPFTNIDSATAGSTLILNTYATTSNPINSSLSRIYASSPNACSSPSVISNNRLTYNIVYFTTLNADDTYTLWRRTVMPSNYQSVGCSAPWQQPSCAPGAVGSMCVTEDVRILDGISSNGFKTEYLKNSNPSEVDTDAVSNILTNSERQAILATTNTVKITISATAITAGKTSSYSDSSEITSQNDYTVATGSKRVKVLVVAGGGGGGSSASGSSGGGGGGGGGGTIYNQSYEVYTGDNITVTIGNGGTGSAAGADTQGGNGGNSVFGTITATGGGGGGKSAANGNNGGSGGGGGYHSGVSKTGGTGIVGQGYDGGSTSLLTSDAGAGGGGSGDIGNANRASNANGIGGAGLNLALSGALVIYGSGGNGGGTSAGLASIANTGEGGDGGYLATTQAYAGATGVVIVSYPTGVITASGGTETTSGLYTIRTFTTSGTFTVN